MVSVTNERITSLTNEQLYWIGFYDGIAGRATDRKFSSSLDYELGHVAGYRACPTSAYNVPAAKEGYLERGWGDELLNPL